MTDLRLGGTKAYLEVPYILATDFNENQIENIEKVFVVIATEDFYGIEQTRITLVQYFKEHIKELEETYSLLLGEESRQVMLEYIRAVTEYDTYRFSQNHVKNKYFFEGTSIKERKEIYRHLRDEVWVNCDANVGDNIFLYFDSQLSAKRIYAFEGDRNCYQTLCSGLDYLPENLKNLVEPINEYISEGTAFSEYISEPVTLINADIQGNELAMLHAMEEIIKRDRPVIAVCVYHLKSDLTDIPQYINNIVGEYRYVLRKYAADVSDRAQTYELVLYAIPKERYVL